MNLRFKTREVKVGAVGIGGTNPIRIQSMTNTNTMDTQACVEQSIRLFDAGCEMVRITAPGVKEAENLAVIKAELKKRGYQIPLIADIHYSPKAAEVAAQIVEKVRINPGNYTDRKRGKINFTKAEYQESLELIRKNITPLIRVCKKHDTALRIGSNHGSLSDRIIDRFGNTPEGMVEAALEFARICRDEDFHKIIFSMKASNVRVMVYATRLLVKKMMDEGMDYPVHLGVTEAGDGIEGRVKSAAGIATLLADGIGDTIRVSLTEPPENEIPVARKIVEYLNIKNRNWNPNIFEPFFYPAFSYQLRKSQSGLLRLNQKPPFVFAAPGDYVSEKPDLIIDKQQLDKSNWQILNSDESLKSHPQLDQPLIATSDQSPALLSYRKLFKNLHNKNSDIPVIFKKHYQTSGDDIAVEAAIDFGPLFLDGFGDGIWIESDHHENETLVSLCFTILQASGSRISKTDFIACPSCGRTQYDIQSSLKKIKTATSHLTGLKIAVMGCIVNGPGEMADADYGYVGMGVGKVALYKGKQQMRKGVDEGIAVEALIDLIKENGDWVEKTL